MNKDTKLWNGTRSHLFKHRGVSSLIAWAVRLVERSGRHPTDFDFAQRSETNWRLHVLPIQSAETCQLKWFASRMVARHCRTVAGTIHGCPTQPKHKTVLASSWIWLWSAANCCKWVSASSSCAWRVVLKRMGGGRVEAQQAGTYAQFPPITLLERKATELKFAQTECEPCDHDDSSQGPPGWNKVFVVLAYFYFHNLHKITYSKNIKLWNCVHWVRNSLTSFQATGECQVLSHRHLGWWDFAFCNFFRLTSWDTEHQYQSSGHPPRALNLGGGRSGSPPWAPWHQLKLFCFWPQERFHAQRTRYPENQLNVCVQ